MSNTRTVTVLLDPSEAAWIEALAVANGVTPNEIFAGIATGIADYAGRRPGSWEAALACDLVRGAGFERGVPDHVAAELVARKGVAA